MNVNREIFFLVRYKGVRNIRKTFLFFHLYFIQAILKLKWLQRPSSFLFIYLIFQ